MIINQGYLFLIFSLNGIIIGIIFDIFRILRKSFKTADFVTYIEDIMFWILTGMVVLYSIFTFSNGEIRFYMFLGIFLGLILYMLLFSKYFIYINVKILKIFKIILHPIKILLIAIWKFFYKPIHIVTINIKKIHFLKIFKKLEGFLRKK